MPATFLENQNVECKVRWDEKYLEWVCGFANAQGGRIYIGINDKGIITGVNNSKELLENIPQKTKSLMGLVVDVNLLKKTGQTYLEICISPSSVAVSLRGHYYYRSGSTKSEITGIALNEFLLKKSGNTWDNVIEPRAVIDDISIEAINEFKKEVQKSGRLPIEIQDLTIQDLLDKLKLTEGPQLKKAAIILFGKDPNKFFPNVRVKIGRFGENLTDLKFQEVIEGNLFFSLKEIISMLTYKFLVKNIKFETFLRIETLEYPEEALKEIILNALVHGRYTGCTIQIRVYDDRISIWNDGLLPDDITLEMLKTHHSSRPRNPLVADVCFKAGLIDSWGRGTLKIIEAMSKAKLPPPEMLETSGGFEVILRKSAITGDTPAITGMSEKENLIIKLLEKNGEMKASSISQAISLSPSWTRDILKKLSEENIVEPFGKNRARTYKIKKLFKP
jgi:ATP-dependent DNA helicase RecG